jgi:DNA-binding MarR family transcriptional regulator
LLGETVALFHRLKAASQEVHGQGELSSGRWGILTDLSRFGPQTVPQMARSRPVSRQYIQTLVDTLSDHGLVELVENPAHRRSSLAQLTAKGESVLQQMNQRASRVFKRLTLTVPEKELLHAATTLRSVRTLFEGKEWQRAVQQDKQRRHTENH